MLQEFVSDNDWFQLFSKQIGSTFHAIRSFFLTVKVVNDIAKRGLKFIANYGTILTGDRQQRSLLILAVE